MGDRLEGAPQERCEVCDGKMEGQHQQKDIPPKSEMVRKVKGTGKPLNNIHSLYRIHDAT